MNELKSAEGSSDSRGSDKEGSLSVKEVLLAAPEAFSNTSVNILSYLQEDRTSRKEYVEEEEQVEPAALKKTQDKRNNVDQVTLYLTRRKIGDFINFLMQHLLVNEPDDPVTFLQELVDKCLMFRSGVLCSAPLLFQDRHIASLYASLDPLGIGSISPKQYRVGLQTLGLKKNEYELNPELQANGSLTKQTFLVNAKMALVESFMDMIMFPPPMEDGGSSIETFYH